MAIGITEQQSADLVPLLTGSVEHAFEAENELAKLFPVKKLSGTDTMIDRVVGRAKVERIDWTEDDKHSQVGTFGSITYKVEHSIYIRHATKNITPLINDIDALKELGLEHGKALAIQRDITILTALLIGSRQGAMTASGVGDADNDLDKTITKGLHIVLGADGDEEDVTEVEKAMADLQNAMKATRKLDKSMSMWVVSYGLYDTLRYSDKLLSKDFSSDNGDYAKGIVSRFLDVPLMPITTFQDLQDVIGDNNVIGDDWSTTALDAEARAVLFTPRALRVLEVMPVTVDAWYEKVHKTNYIDSQAFYGVGVRRQDMIGAIYTWEASQTGTVGAGNELSSNVTSSTYV